MLALAGVVVGIRLVDLQVIRREAFSRLAQMQHEHAVTVPAHRGRILDRDGRPLAESLEVPSIYADTTRIGDPDAAADLLAPILGESRAALRRKLRDRRSFVYLARRVAPDVADRVLALEIPGVDTILESKRFYPAGRLAAQVIGLAGVDGKGLEGAEFLYDEQIGSHPGRVISVRDARGVSVLRYLEHPSQPGQDLQLTLDSVIQYHAEVELDRAMERTRSRWGSVVVMDPSTGAVLAIANRPSFNPNRFQGKGARNRAVQDLYEPGSTFKVVIAAAALEEGRVHPSEVIDCGHGSIRVAGRSIRDHKIFDDLTFAEVIAESSNVGAIKVGTRLPPETFYRYVRAFGFGDRTGIGLPAEGDGLLRAPVDWSGLSQASMSIGQEISVTPLQILRAVAAVGNGGVLVQPYIVATAPRPDAARRVVSSGTARTLNLLLEGVVEHGTGKHASVPGYRVAGKTGTAQKADGANGYGDRHVASFVGYVPARNPALAILIVLDSPRGAYHGGEIAAPVFPRVALPALRRLGIPPDVPASHARTLTLVRGQEPAAPDYREQPAVPRDDDGNPVVPDLAGSTAREALAALARAGLAARVVGQGRVASQDPPPGRSVTEGYVVRLLLSTRARRAGGPMPADSGRARAG